MPVSHASGTFSPGTGVQKYNFPVDAVIIIILSDTVGFTNTRTISNEFNVKDSVTYEDNTLFKVIHKSCLERLRNYELRIKNYELRYTQFYR